ncbi:MAG: hypothetical protein HKL80_11865 [Acidimicrobiales bacterium]|nr:hypothetical protein [Acidimicrobiales bacterium]
MLAATVVGGVRVVEETPELPVAGVLGFPLWPYEDAPELPPELPLF